MQPLEYTAAQRDKVLDDLFAMLPSHNGLVIERLYHSNRRYAIRSFANPAESVDSVTVVKFGTDVCNRLSILLRNVIRC